MSYRSGRPEDTLTHPPSSHPNFCLLVPVPPPPNCSWSMARLTDPEPSYQELITALCALCASPFADLGSCGSTAQDIPQPSSRYHGRRVRSASPPPNSVHPSRLSGANAPPALAIHRSYPPLVRPFLLRLYPGPLLLAFRWRVRRLHVVQPAIRPASRPPLPHVRRTLRGILPSPFLLSPNSIPILPHVCREV